MVSKIASKMTPKETIIHYKYRLFLELGIDPYEAPEKITFEGNK